MMNSGQSEVAHLLRQIETEYEAMQRGLAGYASVARHDFISASMKRMDVCHVALQQLVGEQEAVRLLAETLEAK
jgi:hypothetical protein